MFSFYLGVCPVESLRHARTHTHISDNCSLRIQKELPSKIFASPIRPESCMKSMWNRFTSVSWKFRQTLSVEIIAHVSRPTWRTAVASREGSAPQRGVRQICRKTSFRMPRIQFFFYGTSRNFCTSMIDRFYRTLSFPVKNIFHRFLSILKCSITWISIYTAWFKKMDTIS